MPSLRGKYALIYPIKGFSISDSLDMTFSALDFGFLPCYPVNLMLA